MDVFEKTVLNNVSRETLLERKQMNFYDFIMKRFIERK